MAFSCSASHRSTRGGRWEGNFFANLGRRVSPCLLDSTTSDAGANFFPGCFSLVLLQP